jgi:hypothetical protein
LEIYALVKNYDEDVLSLLAAMGFEVLYYVDFLIL